MSMLTKTLMNAGLFGKFAQKIDSRTDLVHEDNIKILDDGMLEVINEFNEIIRYDSYMHKGDMFFCKKSGVFHIPIFIMPILASYTTALGRIKLWENIYKNDKYIIYIDTDSIFSTKRCFEDSNELGELKMEYKAKSGLFIKPKFYTVNLPEYSKYKLKGYGKKINKEIFNDVLDEKEMRYEKFARFKESLTRKIPFSSIFETPKKFSLEDNKREWGKRFNRFELQESRPLTIEV